MNEATGNAESAPKHDGRENETTCRRCKKTERSHKSFPDGWAYPHYCGPVCGECYKRLQDIRKISREYWDELFMKWCKGEL